MTTFPPNYTIKDKVAELKAQGAVRTIIKPDGTFDVCTEDGTVLENVNQSDLVEFEQMESPETP